jgi:hypothetical protein
VPAVFACRTPTLDSIFRQILFHFQKRAPKEKAEEVPVILGSNGELEGWLLKRGDKGFGSKALVDLTWKKRWFKQSGSKLLYFEGRHSSGPKGEINLPDVISVDPVQSPMFGFHIVTRERIFIVRTQSPPERDLWIKLLRERCPGLTARTSPRLISPDVTTPIEPIPQRSHSSSAAPGVDLMRSLETSTSQPASPRYVEEASASTATTQVAPAVLNQSVSSVPVYVLSLSLYVPHYANSLSPSSAYAPGGIPIYANQVYASSAQPSGMIVDPYGVQSTQPVSTQPAPSFEAPPAEPAPTPYSQPPPQ